MPAVYAHRRFGAEVLACCRNGAARAAIGAFHTLYDAGALINCGKFTVKISRVSFPAGDFSFGG